MEINLWKRILSAFLALVLVLGNFPASALADDGAAPEETLAEAASISEPAPAPEPTPEPAPAPEPTP